MSPTVDTTEPLRTCVGCRTKRPQSALVRYALTADGTPVVSRTAAGRGAWLCADGATCLQQAIKRRGFERAWKRPVAATGFESLRVADEAMMANMSK
ncbi:unannotated protein [freshwater metagenome]|uniref:Unannotated protein n=1 Tax=freshwater metagenome TaxID=449393 RepID=A0A6J7CU40_9ZZZZ|nr:DUF448 domain-containing protein [Actinomycetota bacterium]